MVKLGLASCSCPLFSQEKPQQAFSKEQLQRFQESMKLKVDRDVIGSLPDLKIQQSLTGFEEAQNYLVRYGYATKGELTPGKLDEKTADALKTLRKTFSLPVEEAFDQSVRELMSQPRCGIPDPSPLSFQTRGAWKKRNLSYKFGALPKPKNNTSQAAAKAAVLRALQTWVDVGTGISFTEVQSDPDFTIEWKPAADPDHSMVGGTLAHADFPPGFSIITQDLPKPVHFDDDEHLWKIGSEFDIETVTLHEVGHVLGLLHEPAKPHAVMFPNYPGIRRQLTQDDKDGLRSLYPG